MHYGSATSAVDAQPYPPATHLSLGKAVAKVARCQDLKLAAGGGGDDLWLAIAVEVSLHSGKVAG